MLTPPGWRQRNKVSFCTEVAQTWCFSRQSLIHVHTRDANGPGQRMPGAGLAKRAATSHSFKKSRALPLQEAKPPGNVQKRKQRGLASSPRGTDGLICTREPRDKPRRLPSAVLPTPPPSARHAAGCCAQGSKRASEHAVECFLQGFWGGFLWFGYTRTSFFKCVRRGLLVMLTVQSSRTGK